MVMPPVVELTGAWTVKVLVAPPAVIVTVPEPFAVTAAFTVMDPVTVVMPTL